MSTHDEAPVVDPPDSIISNENAHNIPPIENVLSTSENSNNENREKELQLAESVAAASSAGSTDTLPTESNVETTSSSSKDDEATENSESVDYDQHITYNDKGIAIYTDPSTNYQYEFDNETNEWVDAKEENKLRNVPVTDSNLENDHYRWCSETNKWIAKEQTAETENEFYKWDSEKKEWIPKMHNSAVTTSIVDGVHTYTDKDGSAFFWDETKNAWFPKIDDDFMAKYQMSYGFIDNTSDAKDKSVEKVDAVVTKEVSSEKSETEGAAKRKAAAGAKEPQWFELPEEQNSKVYVSNLPLDITEEEFVELMSKCGMIFRDPGSNKMKIKLYTDSNGQLKGDGLCHYIRIESVALAINLLDGYDVRDKKIKVQHARFQMRGEYNPALKPKKKKKDKDRIKKMQEKLFDWRPEKLRGERAKYERIVILKNLFEPELFEKEVHLLIDYQKDLREECAKCGNVRKVTIFDRHPEGVAQIMMSDPEEADLLIQMMHKRFFGQRQLTAETWDGQTKYKIDETSAETDKRISNWDEFLETDEQNAESSPKVSKQTIAETEEGA